MKISVKSGVLLLFGALFIGLISFTPTKEKEPDLPGINFMKGSLKDARAKAKKENKLVFIDCYTTWCGPCKSMAKKTFVNKEVGQYFNKNFICLKMDMEEGEGPDIAMKYGVDAYPTFLFVNYQGDVKHRELGFLDATRFLEVGKTALSMK